MQELHVNDKSTDDGYCTNNTQRIENYKKASLELDKIVRDTFSLPIETVYTTALKIKLNGEDRKLIHSCYVKGFSNKFSKKDKEGNFSFNKRVINTAIREDKDGNIDYTSMSSDIAKLVISKMC